MVDIQLQLPNGFLDEEERCGYVVSSQMKEVWAIELDLLAEFQRVCKQYDLKYYADAGTLLGAVRHKGFIPWDDDIDIIMTRDEYNKLCRIAMKEFKHPFFFQTNKTDPGSSKGHAQLRNSITTAILGGKEYVTSHNQGVFIDIFPVDVLPDNRVLRKLHSLLLKSLYKAYYFFGNCSVNYNSEDKRGKWKLRKFLYNFYKTNFYMMNHFYNMFEKTCSIFNNWNSECHSILCSGYDKYSCKRSWYDKN